MSYAALYNEALILRQIAGGDQQAFAVFFDHYHPNIYASVLKVIEDNEVAEEIVQDVFVKIWNLRHRLPGMEHLAGWMYTIATNETYTLMNRERRAKKRMADAQGASFLFRNEQTPFVQLEEKEYADLLHQAIERLPEKQQLTYKMIREMGMTRQEVASSLQVSPETVKEHLSRATKSIHSFCLKHMSLLALMLLIK